jgi:hypothetical protein
LLLKGLAESRTTNSGQQQSVITAGQYPKSEAHQTETEAQSSKRPERALFSRNGSEHNADMQITVRYTPRGESQIYRAHAQVSPVVTILAPDPIITIDDMDIRASLVFMQTCEMTNENHCVIDESRVTGIEEPVQIQTRKVSEEAALRALRQAFSTQKEKTEFFIVVTDNKRFDSQKTGMWVDVRYTPTQKSSDNEGSLLCRGDSTHTLQVQRVDNSRQPLVTGIVATLGLNPGAVTGNLEARIP